MTNLQHHFLIAMPHLSDPEFFHSVTYICEHTDEGALGFVINRPLGITLSDVFSQMQITSVSTTVNQRPVFSGGPVQIEQGFVLHRSDSTWQSSHRVNEFLSVTTSRDILQAIADDQGPNENLVVLGYAGWDAGQLEQEISQNFWLNAEADPSVIFDAPISERWETAVALLGINVNDLISDAGHD